MANSEQLHVRFSPDERQSLLALAEHYERKPSDVVRLLIRTAAEVTLQPAEPVLPVVKC